MKQSISVFAFLTAWMLCQHVNAQSDVNITCVQQQLVAKMTGKSEVKPSVFLAERSRKGQRRKSVVLLLDALEKASLEPEIHSYRYPNVNFFIDLLFDPFRGVNVYATIPATIQSDEYVILGAHYDSEPGAPGADDNASGVALIYAVGRELSKLEYRRVNFMIVFFDQEESDEVGSKAFVRMIRKEGMKVHSVHIADMVGWDSDNNRTVDVAPGSSELVTLYSNEAEKQNIPVYTSNAMSSDHKSFHDEGYSAVLLSENGTSGDFNPYYHSEKDTYEIINFDYLLSCTQLVLGIMKQLAQ